ncbi:MAG: signal peptidase I [Thaumarchaeota archaeon]|nr:signal peptidase I [Nitrososphaerota archaeon]
MSLSKSVSRAITYVLIVIVIVAGAQVLVGSAEGSSPVYVVVSKSMVPTLQIGDLVITEKASFSSIHVGQVIVYQQPTPSGTCPNPYGLTIVHRVVAITPSGLITQGDDRKTNPYPDEPTQWPPVPAECVKGVVVLAVPYLGLISMLIPYPWNYALVGLILVFVFVSELRPSEPAKGKSGRTRAASSENEREPPGPSPSPGTFPPS